MSRKDQKWSGKLTTANVEKVARRLRELLTGKPFSLVIAEEHSNFKPVLRTTQALNPNDPIKVFCAGKGKGRRVSLLIHDSQGVTELKVNTPKKSHDSSIELFSFQKRQVTFQGRLQGKLVYLVYGLEVK